MISCWPVREILIAYVAHIRQRLEDRWSHSMLTYAPAAVWMKNLKPPVIPTMLEDPDVDA